MASSRCERLLHSQLQVCKFQSAYALCDGLIYQSMDLMAIGSKNIVLAAGKVGMYLSREERILRVFVSCRSMSCAPRARLTQKSHVDVSVARHVGEERESRKRVVSLPSAQHPTYPSGKVLSLLEREDRH